MNMISRIFNALRGTRGRSPAAAQPGQVLTPTANSRAYFDLLKAYYLNNALYDETMSALRRLKIWNEPMKPIRNPAMRATEFYASTLWPGALDRALEVKSDNSRLAEPIGQIWRWSNWGAVKQRAARWFGLYGNLFIKAAQRDDGRPYLQLIEPQNISDFRVDERGFITYIQINTPQVRQIGDAPTAVTRTEVWDKASQTFWLYEHQRGDDAPDKLGEPKETKSFEEFGIDFVPVVFAMKTDIGDQWGAGCFSLALDKIDEANRVATRLHQLLFKNNKNSWAVSANGMDASGRPLPAPRLQSSTNDPAGDEKGKIMLGDEEVFYLPGNSTLQSLVPNVNYLAALQILQDHMRELENDLPELTYYRLRDFSQLSGKAIRLMLSTAIDRAVEARGNAEDALARADMMALTLGVTAGVFANIGDFESGDFEHTFKARPVLAPDQTELLQDLSLKQGLGVPDKQLQIEAGYTEGDFEQWDEWRAERPPAPNMAGSAIVRLLANAGAGTDADADADEPLDEREEDSLLRR